MKSDRCDLSVSKKSGYYRTLGLHISVLVLLYIILFIQSVICIIPYNPSRELLSRNMSLELFMPQGWNFFTANPRVEQTVAYKKTANGWGNMLKWPHASRENLFGLRRTGRAQGLELGLILQELPAQSFVDCRETIGGCLDKVATVTRLENLDPSATLCGFIGLVAQQPVPWAWTRSGQAIKMSARVAKAFVQCSH